MKDNPPAKADAPMVAKMAKLGIVPGAPSEFRKLDLAVQKVLKDLPKVGFEKIMAHFKSAGKDIDGWIFTTKTGLHGTDYLQCALVTAIDLGANRPQDAVCLASEIDAEGKTYKGADKHAMRFPRGDSFPCFASAGQKRSRHRPSTACKSFRR